MLFRDLRPLSSLSARFQGVCFLLRWLHAPAPTPAATASTPYIPPASHNNGAHHTHLLTPGPRARIKRCVAYLSDILETGRAAARMRFGICAGPPEF